MALKKLPGSVGRLRVTAYGRNVAKSFGYALADLMIETNPVIKTMAENTKDAYEDISSDIDRFISDGGFEELKKYTQAPKEILKNFGEDIKTGNWYNKARQDKMEQEMMASMDTGGDSIDWGDDWGDDFGDDWDSDSNDNWDEEDTAKAVVAEDDKNTNRILTAIDSAGFGVATAINQGQAASAEYLADSGRANTQALLKNQSHGFAAMSQSLMTLNSNIASLGTVMKPLATHMQNSATFFTNTTEQLKHISETLDKMLENTTPKQAGGSPRGNITSFSDLIDADDVFDVSSWLDMVKKNFKDDKELVDMATNALKSIDPKNISIGTMMTKMMTQAILPTMFRDSLKGFNETLKYGVAGAFGKMRNKLSESFIGSLISQYIFPEDRLKTKVNTGNYEKGPVAWDGYARKALTDVIPTILFKIHSAVSGEDEMRYNFETGKYTTVKKIAKEREKELQDAYRSAGGEYRNDVLNRVDERYRGTKDYDKIVDLVEKYFQWAVETGKPTDFNAFKRSVYARRTKLTPTVIQIFREIQAEYKAAGIGSEVYNRANKFATVSVQSARDSISKATDYAEESGISILNALADGSYTTPDGKTKKLTNSAKIANGMAELFGKDKYGNTAMNYLQGIYQYQASVYELLEAGWIPGKGKGKGKKGKMPAIPKPGMHKMGYIDKDAEKADINAAELKAWEEFYSALEPMYASNGKLLGYCIRSNDKKDYDKKTGEYKIIVKYTLNQINDIRKEIGLKPIAPGGRDSNKLSVRENNKATGGLGPDEWKDAKTGITYKKSASGALEYARDKVQDYFAEKGFNIKTLSQAPFDAAASLMTNMANGITDLLWGKDGEPDKSLFASLKDKADEAFDWMKEAWQEHMDKDVNNLFNKLFGEKGEDGKREGGFFSDFINETKSSLGEAFGFAKDTVGEHWYGKRYKDVKKASQEKRYLDTKRAEFAKKRNAERQAMAETEAITEEEAAEGAARGRKVTKSGMIAVSEGELVIPPEYNPFYHRHVSLARRMYDEKQAVNNFYGSFAKGVKAVGEEGEISSARRNRVTIVMKKLVRKYGYDMDAIMADPDFEREKITDEELDNWMKIKSALIKKQRKGYKQDAATEEGTGANFVGQMKKSVTDGISTMMAKIFGKDDDIEKAKEEIQEKTKGVFEKIGENKGAIGAGAVIGAGTSLLTGALVGPLAGAAIGAGVGYIMKSQTAQDALFGKFDENRESDGSGILSKEMSEFIKNKLPGIGVAAGIGGAAGMFLGSPLMGAVIGAGVGFISKSDSAKKFLFGDKDDKDDDGIISKELQEKIKKTVPGMAVGAIAGMVAGPFGLVGNLALGAGIGMLASSEDMKNKLFGEKDENGKRKGGLLGAFKEKIVDKVDELFRNTTRRLGTYMKRLGRTVTRGVVSGVKGVFGFLKAAGGKLLSGSKIGQGIMDVAGRLGTGATNFLANRATNSKAKNIKAGVATYDAKLGRNLTAREVLNIVNDKGNQDNKYIRAAKDNMYQMDVYQGLANIEAGDQEALTAFKNQADWLDNAKYKKKELSQEQLQELKNSRAFQNLVTEKDGKLSLDQKALKKINTIDLRKLANSEDKNRISNKDKVTEEFQVNMKHKSSLLAYLLAGIADGVTHGTSYTDALASVDVMAGETNPFNLIKKNNDKKEDEENKDKEGTTEGEEEKKGGLIDTDKAVKGESNDNTRDSEGIERKPDGTPNFGDKMTKAVLKTKDEEHKAQMDSTELLGKLYEEVHEINEDVDQDDEEKEEKKSLFDKMKDFFGGEGSLFGKFSKLISGEAGGIKQVLFDMLGAGGAIAVALAPLAGIAAVMTGKADKAQAKISNNKLQNGYGSTVLGNGYWEKHSSYYVVTDDGQEIGVICDEHGNPVFDDHGDVVGVDGNPYPAAALQKAQSDHRIQTRAWTDLARNVIRGTAGKSVLARSVKGAGKWAKTVLTKSKSVGRMVERGQKAGRAIAGAFGRMGTRLRGTKVAEFAGGFVKKFAKIGEILSNLLKNVAPKMADKLDDFVRIFSDDGLKIIGRELGEKVAKSSLGKAAKAFAGPLNIILAAGDAINGWGNYCTNLGIIEEVLDEYEIGTFQRTQMRLLSALIGVIEGYIPVDLFASNEKITNFLSKIPGLANIFGIDNLDELQKASAEWIDKYNTEHKTDFTVETWNLSQGNAGILTRAKEGLKNFKDKFKDMDKAGQIEHQQITGNRETDLANANAISTRNASKVSTATHQTKKDKENAQIKKAMNSYSNGQMVLANGSVVMDPSLGLEEETGEGSRLSGGDSTIRAEHLKAMKKLHSKAGKTANIMGLTKADDTTLFAQAVTKMQTSVTTGDILGVARTQFTPSTNTTLSWIYKGAFTVTKFVNMFMALFNKVKDGAAGVIEKVGSFFKGIIGKGDSDDKTADSKSGGAFMQNGEGYSNLPYAGSTFGAKGCGPAAAVNFARSIGMNMSPEEAIAASGKYQDNIGTKASYFSDLFGSKGVNVRGIKNKDIMDNLRAGNSTILLGEDRSNKSKARSPFKNPHYVVADGIKGNKVHVIDSESGSSYYPSSILKNVKYAMSGGGFSGGAGEGGVPYDSVLRIIAAMKDGETKNSGPGFVTNMNGADGTTWNYGIASFTKESAMPLVMDFLKKNYPEYYKQLKGSVGSDEFNKSWKALGEADPEGFSKAQADFVLHNNIINPVNTVKKRFGIDLNNGKYTEGFFSIFNTANNWVPAFYNADGNAKYSSYKKFFKEGMSNEEAINAVYNTLLDQTDKYNSKKYDKGWRNRWEREKQFALALNKPFSFTGNGGITGSFSSNGSKSDKELADALLATTSGNNPAEDTTGATTGTSAAAPTKLGLAGILAKISSAFAKIFTGGNDEEGSEGQSGQATPEPNETNSTTSQDNPETEIPNKASEITPAGKKNRESVLEIARSQVGYQEKASNNKLEEFHENVGTNNWTKYGAFTGANGPGKGVGEWCASFVSWVFDQAYNGDKDLRNKVMRGPTSPGVSALWNNFKSNNAIDKTPQPGDIIIYKNGTSHTGIVESVDEANKTFTSIEGNTDGKNGTERDGGQVARKENRPWNFNQVTGFGHPNWDAAGSMLSAAGSGLYARGVTKSLLRKRPSQYVYSGGAAAIDARSGLGFETANRMYAKFDRASEALENTRNVSDTTERLHIIRDIMMAMIDFLKSISANTEYIQKIYDVLSKYCEGAKVTQEEIDKISAAGSGISDGEKKRVKSTISRTFAQLGEKDVDPSFRNFVNKVLDIAKG